MRASCPEPTGVPTSVLLEEPTREQLSSSFWQLNSEKHPLFLVPVCNFNLFYLATTLSTKIRCRNPIWEMGQDRADLIFLTIKRKIKCFLPIRLASAVKAGDAGAGAGVGKPELSQEMACWGV